MTNFNPHNIIVGQTLYYSIYKVINDKKITQHLSITILSISEDGKNAKYKSNENSITGTLNLSSLSDNWHNLYFRLQQKTMPNLIGICGNAGAGKDTIAMYIRKKLSCGYALYRFADRMKDFLCRCLNVHLSQLEDRQFKESPFHSDQWNGEKSPREMMQIIGTEVCRQIHPDFWVRALFAHYEDDSRWIVPDVRFKNESEAIKANDGVLIKVVRPSIFTFNLPTMKHQSETELESIVGDYTIINDGTIEELYAKIDDVLQKMVQ